ncbi:MAG: RnfABCDGE type electron transport complex subunit B, partial [Pygmaiobacter sp.]
MSITLAIIIVTVIGLIGAAILVVAAKFMTVEEDERIGIVAAALPAANCGACGYAGCSDYAKAIVEDGAPVNRCVPGGQKAADAVAAVMGVEAASSTPMRATVMCQGSQENCKTKFEYHGIQSCAAAAGFYGGPSACQYGCLGYGDCVAACKFDAIKIV